VQGPGYKSRNNGYINILDASAILKDNRLSLFLTNRDLHEPAPVRIKLADGSLTALESGETLTGPDLKAANSFEQPAVVRSHPFGEVSLADDQALLELPPASFTALTFNLG